MKIFVTGGTGQLGEHLVPELTKRGADLILLSRREHASFGQIEYVTGDLLEPGTYEQALNKIDIIIHMAAVTHTNDRGLYYRVNTEGTALLTKLAERQKIRRFIFLSTRAVSESGGEYCLSKKMAEDIVRKSHLKWIIIRPAEIYGVSKGEGIAQLIALIKNSPIIPIMGNGVYKLAPVHVDDVVAAVVAIIRNDECAEKIYNLSGPDEFTYVKLVETIARTMNLHRKYIIIPIFWIRVFAGLIALSGSKRPSLVKDQIPRLLSEKSSDISLARSEFGYNPRSIDQFLRSP
jgi:nucleoside-diphosphate-sugar epimerase